MTAQVDSQINLEALDSTDRASVLHCYSSLQKTGIPDRFIVSKAEGITLTDVHGNDYIDAGAGLWCVNIGYGRESMARIAAEQMLQTSYLHSFSNFSNEPLIRLSEKLLELAPGHMRRVFYSLSGSDANDTQVKIVHRYNNLRGKPQKKKIISRRAAYHGSTTVAGSLTGIEPVHWNFDLPLDGILHTEAAHYHWRPAHIDTEEEYVDYLVRELEDLIRREGPDTIAAFIAEPVGGSGGVLVPPGGYFAAVHKVLEKYDIMLIADEVITAFGRVGEWFASERYAMHPDLITVSKGITSGYFPLSACLVSEKICDVLYGGTGDEALFYHGFTSSGHPVGAALALENIRIMEAENLLENAERTGSYLQHRIQTVLQDHEHVGHIRGAGLMIGIEFDRVKEQRKPFADVSGVSSMLSRSLFEENLICRSGHGAVIVAMAPPLTLTEAQADEIVNRLERGVHRFTGKLKVDGLI